MFYLVNTIYNYNAYTKVSTEFCSKKNVTLS